jgi:hypothetical protein
MARILSGIDRCFQRVMTRPLYKLKDCKKVAIRSEMREKGADPTCFLTASSYQPCVFTKERKTEMIRAVPNLSTKTKVANATRASNVQLFVA